MPSFAIVLIAIAAVLGTLVVTPVSPDLRAVADLCTTALAVYVAVGPCGPPRFRVLVALALVAAATNAEVRQRAGTEIVERPTARYAATLLDRAAAGDGSTEIALALDRGPRVLARVRGAVPFPGTRVVVRGRLEPFDTARNPGETSERDIEAERGFDGRLDAATMLGTLPSTQQSATVLLARAHEWAHDRLRAGLGEPAASLVAGELWGERAALPPELRAEFQETGTVHLLVTAGLHEGAVLALCVALLGFVTAPRLASCAIAIALLWIFAWWSGGQLPAVRAAAMASTALAARSCGRATMSWNALAIAAFLIAVARPQSVATASFALSFSCVSAIFACAAPLERWVEARIALPARAREAVVLSLATQVGIWPLGAAVFLQFTPYSVAANFAVVPCVAATMALGAAQLAFAWIAPLAQACANLDSWLIAWTFAVVRTVGELPGAVVPMTPAPAWCIAAYDVTIVSAPLLWRRGARTIALAAVFVASAWVLWPPRALDARLRVTVLDVGQADAIVVQTPRGHAILVDAGGRLERGAQGDDSVAERVGERTVVPFLLRHGIHELDAVVISHPHGDHAGGVAPVLRRLRVAELADGGQHYGGHAYQDALATARGEGVPVAYPRAGMQWTTGDGVAVRFLGPSLPLIANSRNDINENSVAFTLRYGSFCMLFTGDAGASAEQRFLSGGADLRCGVLKVGHHGSAYSSTPAFIAAVHPRYAIISVGRHNLFGHPAPSTLETLRRYGVTIYRTDENGAVTITYDGTAAQVEPMLP